MEQELKDKLWSVEYKGKLPKFVPKEWTPHQISAFFTSRKDAERYLEHAEKKYLTFIHRIVPLPGGKPYTPKRKNWFFRLMGL